MRTPPRALLGLAGLLLAAGAAAGCAAPDQDTTGAVKFTDTAESVAFSAELLAFEDLGTMTATADLVIKGTVTRVGMGRSSGSAEDGGVYTTRVVDLRVDEVIFQKQGRPAPTSVTLAEGYWDAAGIGYMDEGVPWSKVGDMGYFYLSGPDKQTGGYALVWSQGRVLIGDSGLRISGHHEVEGPWAGIIANGRSSIEASIAAAAEAAKSGRAKAAKPEMCSRAPEMAACQG